MDYIQEYKRWLDNADAETVAELKAIENDANEIKERFYKNLEFGTAGLRGIIGAGSNSSAFPHEVSNTETKTNKIAIGVIFFI